MLQITIPSIEEYDEATNTFILAKEKTIQLEHSLVSISKWESRWLKPFLTKDKKTVEETKDYIKCMTITQNVDESVYRRLTMDNLKEVTDYIEHSKTATTIKEPKNGKKNNEIMTSELIYYYMVALQIPFECQKWHLNRLMMLIRVCNIKQSPPKKRGRKDILSQNAALNAKRRSAMNSKG